MYHSMKDVVVIIDVETGGLNASHHSLLSMALIAVDQQDHVIAEDSFYVAEDTLILSPDAMTVNQIAIATIRAQGLPPDQAFDRFMAFYAKIAEHYGLDANAKEKKIREQLVPLTFSGQNVQFDLQFLARLFTLNRAMNLFNTYVSHRTLDLTSVARFLVRCGVIPVEVGSSASKVWAHYGIAPDEQDRHTAIGDARASRKLLTAMIQEVKGLINDGGPALV